jgi:hypothetical protein
VSRGIDFAPRLLAQTPEIQDRQRLLPTHGVLQDESDLLGNRPPALSSALLEFPVREQASIQGGPGAGHPAVFGKDAS